MSEFASAYYDRELPKLTGDPDETPWPMAGRVVALGGGQRVCWSRAPRVCQCICPTTMTIAGRDCWPHNSAHSIVRLCRKQLFLCVATASSCVLTTMYMQLAVMLIIVVNKLCISPLSGCTPVAGSNKLDY